MLFNVLQNGFICQFVNLHQIVESFCFEEADCSFTVFPPEKFPHVLYCDILMTGQFFVAAESINIIETILPERFGDDLFNRLAKLYLSFGEVRPAIEYKTKSGLIIVSMI